MPGQGLEPFSHFEIREPIESAEATSTDLRSILGILLRHWKLIAIIFVIAMIGTNLIMRCVPVQYKSVAEILVVNPKLQNEAGRPPSAFDIDAAALSTEIALIQSKSLALRVAKELNLDTDSRFLQRGLTSQILEALRFPQLLELLGSSRQERPDETPPTKDASGQPSSALDEAADDLRERIKVDRLGLSYVLAISITTQDAALSQGIVDAVAKNFFAEQHEARAEARQQASGWLRNWVSELRASLSETEGQIEKLKAESGLSDTGLAVNVTEQRMSELNKQLASTQAEVMEKKFRLEQARQQFESGGDIQAIPDVMASNIISQLRRQQSELKWKEQELRNRLGDRHGEVLALRQQLSSLNRQMGDEAQHIITNLQSTYNLALERQQSLEASLRKLATSGSDNTSAYAQLRALQPAADAKRKLFEQALGELDQLSRRETADGEGGRVIAPASVPHPPSALRRVLYYGIAGVFAIGLGSLVAFLPEYLQSGFSTHTMAERTLGYPVLAMIPDMRRRFRRSSGDLLADALIRGRRSQLSAAVETARIVLGFPNAGIVPRVILLTSAISGEGKSAVARLLATSSALAGRRTALVDCDLHHSSLSAQFGKTDTGLAQVLCGETDIASVTVNDPATGLSVIPAGAVKGRPADLLSSQAMQDFVEKLRRQYDYVVLDASPLLPVVDALALAAIADKIVMIVQWGRTSRTSVSQALKTLKFAGYSIAGLILNKVDYRRLSSYGYGFGKDYNYGTRFRAIGKY